MVRHGSAWAAQATRSAARIAELEAEAARLTELLTGVQEAMMYASERIAEVEDWLVLVRDGAQPVGSVVHEIAACKEAYWYLWDAPSAKALHSAAVTASEAARGADDVKRVPVVSVHDTAALRATGDERGGNSMKLRAMLRDWRGFLACFRIRCPKCGGYYFLPGEVAAMGGRQCRCDDERGTV